MAKIGLFFGSFNPIHIGHLALSNYMLEFTGLDEVWFVVSPQNPFKSKSSLLHQADRLEMVEMATKNVPGYKASNIEFYLPKPSFTIDTLAYLSDKNRQHEFVILMGEDSLKRFHHWKNHEKIIELYTRYIYPRSKKRTPSPETIENAYFFDAPLIEISSSFIRDSIREGKNMTFFLPPGIYDYINKMQFYV